MDSRVGYEDKRRRSVASRSGGGERRGKKPVRGRAKRGVWVSSAARTLGELVAKVSSAARDGKKRKSGKRGKWSILAGEDISVAEFGGRCDPN